MPIESLLQQKRQDILRIAINYGARRVRVSGSMARGADAGGDVDILVEPGTGRSLSTQADCDSNVGDQCPLPSPTPGEITYSREQYGQITDSWSM